MANAAFLSATASGPSAKVSPTALCASVTTLPNTSRASSPLSPVSAKACSALCNPWVSSNPNSVLWAFNSLERLIAMPAPAPAASAGSAILDSAAIPAPPANAPPPKLPNSPPTLRANPPRRLLPLRPSTFLPYCPSVSLALGYAAACIHWIAILRYIIVVCASSEQRALFSYRGANLSPALAVFALAFLFPLPAFLSSLPRFLSCRSSRLTLSLVSEIASRHLLNRLLALNLGDRLKAGYSPVESMQPALRGLSSELRLSTDYGRTTLCGEDCLVAP